MFPGCLGKSYNPPHPTSALLPKGEVITVPFFLPVIFLAGSAAHSSHFGLCGEHPPWSKSKGPPPSWGITRKRRCVAQRQELLSHPRARAEHRVPPASGVRMPCLSLPALPALSTAEPSSAHQLLPFSLTKPCPIPGFAVQALGLGLK